VTLRNIGLVYYNKNQYEQALKYYGDARKVFELTGKSSKDYGITFINIGVLYDNKKEYEQALKYYKQAQTIY